MKKLIALLLSLCLCLALCGCSGTAGTAQKSITVFNWEDYIDPEILEEFTEETGIQVKYQRFTTNEDMYIKLVKSGADYDVVFPSDYLIERFIAEDLVAPLDKSKLSNLENNYDWLLHPDYDPDTTYSVPYMWGTVGVLYNYAMTGEDITSWRQLWDVKYKDQVCMMDSLRDTMGVTLKMLGYSMNTHDIAALEAARDALIEQKTSGVLLAYGVDDIKDKLINGECAIGLVWSGDAVYSMGYNEDLRYSVPEEGSNVWLDGMVIPKSSTHKDEAHEFINFLMRPDIAARNSEYIGYSTPNEKAMDMLDAELSGDPTFNPPQDVIDRCEWFHDLPADLLPTYEKLFTEVTAQ